ncbi:MAG TPA: four helix bundle protein [Chloroflexia bacterium]|nr:four helix bundle protein [Chloroflexia bacterium]
MKNENLKARTKGYALRIIRLVGTLSKDRTVDVLARQLLRAGTSVGANYRAACRAKSTADFIAKMGIVEEEADESLYWMELLIDGDFVPEARLTELMQEGNEIIAIVVASIRAARNAKA